MKEKLLIIGASGHGKVVADIAKKMNKWENIAFLDDNLNTQSSNMEIVGETSYAFEHLREYDFFVGIGNNNIRLKIQDMLEANGASIPILIHPSAIIGEQVEINYGTVIMAGVVVNCCSKIGKGTIINTGSTIDHDNLVGDFVHISPGVHLAGAVKVGQESWLGIGSTVSNNISITHDCIVGAGAVVIKDLSEPGTYIGVPARRIING
ncbi:acetyltransferase [Paenisporosarcina quisquiliarum]|uniref:Acetyltransferase n=1 Tax=Paenisporosarcina quisquiliarum TaxID=365346 RepID=A0A9X3LG28_9BACL|nr:acetyltransferase [Paenisporosarcina quisquiliarum]MCZ8537251.1 acetyltransferase [Paenisporosarcina quisquiliarum]